MMEWVTLVPLLVGLLLFFIAGVGVLRMPDSFLRMQAASKASSLGAGFVLAAVAIHFHVLSVSSRALAAIVLLFITIPVSTHLLARAAYLAGIPLWTGTVRDELAEAIEKGDYVPPPQDAPPPTPDVPRTP